MITTMALAGVAAWLWVLAPPGRGLARLTAAPSKRARAANASLSVALVAGCVLVALVTGRFGWAVAAAVAVISVWWVSGRHRRRQRVARGRREVAQAATTMALLMRSGMIPHQALQEAAEECNILGGPAAASRLGASVADAFDEAGTRPGGEGMAVIAAAWRVSHTTGAPVAQVLHQVAETLRDQHRVEAVVESEISAARTSSRVMACLPVVALLLGHLMGSDPLGFYEQPGLSDLLLVAGIGLSALGVVWTEKLTDRALP